MIHSTDSLKNADLFRNEIDETKEVSAGCNGLHVI